MSVYAALGITPIINAKGPSTRVSGGLLSPAVSAAMAEAASLCVDMADLQAAASAVIARHTGAEAGIVTSGAAAGLLLGSAACLARLDPAAAARIHPHDRNNTLRALEIRLLTGQPSADVFAQGLDALTGYRTLQLGLDPPRHLLYANLDARCVRMWQAGLVEETAHLLTLYPPSAKPFAALGYKQAVDVLAGRLPAPAALAEMQTKTRQYAKRQLTWFRAEPGVVWLPGFGPQPEIVEKSFRATEHFLRSFV